MKIGICLPYMKPGLSRDDLLTWFKIIDDGPFESLSCGERVHGPTFDMRLLLSAAATATTKVEITPTLYVLPMHNAVRVAKEIASLNVISGGRVKKVVLGYGGRPQDYEAVGAAYNGRYQRMDHQVQTLKQVWSGQEIIEGAGSIGPDLAPEEHPLLLTGAIGPKSISRGGGWADGLYAWSGNGEAQELATAFSLMEEAFEKNERSQKPYRLGGFWCTLADSGQQKLFDYVFEYLSIAGQEIAQMMAESVSRSSEQAILDALDNAESAECDEVFLVPATAEIQEIERLSNLVIRR